jgi:hypothetical protein
VASTWVRCSRLVKVAEHEYFHQHTSQAGGSEGRQNPEEKRAGGRGYRGADIGADHVKGTVGEVNNPHDAEHESQAGGHQK